MKKAILSIFLVLIIMNLIFTAVSLVKMFPKKPAIKHEEFPFVLKYEIDGNIYEARDVLVCDYDGVSADTAKGIYRRWKSHLASDKTKITLLKNDEIEIFFTPNINPWEAGAYYMGDNEIYTDVNIPFPNAWYTNDFENEIENAYIISSNEMWEKYKLKLLMWEIAPPIKNEFK